MLTDLRRIRVGDERRITENSMALHAGEKTKLVTPRNLATYSLASWRSEWMATRN